MKKDHIPTRKPRMRYGCPDCGAPLVRRTSEVTHPLLQSLLLVCRNVVCGATFKGVAEITHRLSPPACPNPDIALPYASSKIRGDVLRAEGLPASGLFNLQGGTQ